MEKSAVDILWILISGTLVFIMQAGFAMVESGMTRSKNSINVAIKNLTDLGISTVFFWAFGFAFMFGVSFNGFIGASNFFFTAGSLSLATFVFFQITFCSTSATIVSGAVAERMKYSSYIISTIIMSVIIYPVFGHWAWGGVLDGTGSGWLASKGFIDFAGSTVVHSMGGWVALAILLIIGPRLGRFTDDGGVNRINGSNIPIAVLGVMLLWFGWFGFNGGSTLALNDAVAGIILRTTLAAAAGMMGALFAGWPIFKKADINLVLNGSLAGLVAITACCHVVSEVNSVIIGAAGGIIMMLCTLLLERLKIDDAVGAIPVHLAAGIWGTLCVGIFGSLELIGTGLDRWSQIVIQLIGILSCGVWGFGVSFAALFIINKIFPLRISAADERAGLNVTEHGVTTEILDLYITLAEQAKTGDISKRAIVEPFTEVGQIAGMYNNVLEKLESSTVEKTDYVSILDNVSDGLFLMDKGGIISPYHSSALEKIFEKTEIAGSGFTSLISSYIDSAVLNSVKDYQELLFDISRPMRTLEKINPLREAELFFDLGTGEFKNKFLEFAFKRIEKGDSVFRVMVLVRDVTTEKELAKEIEDTQKRTSLEMELFYRVLHVEPGTFSGFIYSALDDLDRINSTLSVQDGDPAEKLREIFRITHSIKGDSDMLGFDFLADFAHEIEDNISALLKRGGIKNDDFLSVIISFSEFKSIMEKMELLFNKWGAANSDEMPADGKLSLQLETLVKKLSERHNKKAVIDCGEVDSIVLSTELKKAVKDILVQLIRNSMFHGIEDEKTRTESRKNPEGRIGVSLSKNDDTVTLVYSDDGQGLDEKKIARKMAEEGHTGEIARRDILKYIFTDSGSTASSVNKSAGRGVGLALVKSIVLRHKGKILVDSRQGESLKFTVTLKAGKE